MIKVEKKKMGRPTDDPKTFIIKARINEDMHNRVEKYCVDNNVSRTDIVRMGLKKVLEETNKKE